MKPNPKTYVCAMFALTVFQPIAPAWATGTGWANGSGACLAECALDEHICVTNAQLAGGNMGNKLRNLGGLPPVLTVAECQLQADMCDWICEHPASAFLGQATQPGATMLPGVGPTSTKSGK